MGSTDRAMTFNRRDVPPRVREIDDELAALRASSAYELARSQERAAAEAPIIERRAKLASDFLTNQRGLLEGARRAWVAHTPGAVQREAAIRNPERAVAIAELARLVSPAEQAKIAERLVAEEDAGGAYGLRAVSDDEAVTVAMMAGCNESTEHLKSLLRCQREFARSIALVERDPERTLAAIYESESVVQEDGASRNYTEGEINALIGAPEADA